MNRLYILFGTGVMSGSLILSLKNKSAGQKSNGLNNPLLQSKVIGLDTSETNLNLAKQRKIIDVGYALDPSHDSNHSTTQKIYQTLKNDYLNEAAISQHGFDDVMLVIASPVGAFEGIFKNLARLNLELSVIQRLTITDVGSTKNAIILQAESLGNLKKCFVPAHPIAGREKSGPDAAVDDLYKNKYCFLTPLTTYQNQTAYQKHIAKVHDMWCSVGAIVVKKTPEKHDALFSKLSHTPHFLAFAAYYAVQAFIKSTSFAVDVDESSPNYQVVQRFLRIAHSSPAMWRDIAEHNPENILNDLEKFIKDFEAFTNRYVSSNPKYMLPKLNVLIQSTTYHSQIIQAKDAPQVDFNLDDASLLFFPLVISHVYLHSIIQKSRKPNESQDLASLKYAGTGLHDFTIIFKNKDVMDIVRNYFFLQNQRLAVDFKKMTELFKVELNKIKVMIENLQILYRSDNPSFKRNSRNDFTKAVYEYIDSIE
jgi:prephenate dehydrogenase